MPAFLLHAVEQPEPLLSLLEHVDDAAERNDHFEFYWYPHTDRTQTKRNNRVPAGTAAEAAAARGASGSTTTCWPTGSSR